MASKEMYALGSQASVIRDLFAYGQQQAAVVGKENVFDFSIGNPTVPAPACVKEAIEEILPLGPYDCQLSHCTKALGPGAVCPAA